MQKKIVPLKIMTFLSEKRKTIGLLLSDLYEKWLHLKRQYPRGAWGILIVSCLGIAGFLFSIIFYLSIRFEVFDRLPTISELREIENNIASQVYTEDGKLLGKYYIQNRVNSSLEEISPDLLNALVATEDVRYFDHNGIDLYAWLRVFFKSILLQEDTAGGGSTLSQQLAKNLYSRKHYLFLSLLVNKVREMIIARRLESIYSKNELLTLYLNTVSFSENTFGVKVASRRFFDTKPMELRLEEAAILVGMLKGTAIYNPLNYPERALKRRNTVLYQMNKYGYINKAVADSLAAIPLKLKYSREGNTEGSGTYFREYLRKELKKILVAHKKPDGSNYNIYTDGLKIHTTIDSRLQKHAEAAVTKHMSKLQTDFFRHWKRGLAPEMKQEIEKIVEKTPLYKRLKSEGKPLPVIEGVFRKPKKMTVFTWAGEEEREMSLLDSIQYYFMMLNTGFLAMEPQNGHIKAWVGGNNNKYFQYDHVKSTRQAGSTFKPLVYAAAINQEIPPCDYLHNRLTIYTEYDDWKPENSDGNYGGVYSMEGALSHSVNAITVDLIMRTGIDSVKQLAENMGVSSTIPEVPAIALGAVDVSLYDMVSVYVTFANNGFRPEPRYIRRIETNDGEILIDFDTEESVAKQVLKKTTAQIITKMLQSVVDSGTAKRLRHQYHLSNDIAGKTGTTQNHSDGWFIGYTPKLVAGVWVGASSPKAHFRTISFGQGANMALPVWAHFMEKVNNDSNFRSWKKASFPALSDSLLWELDCPPYLEEMPVWVDWEKVENWPASLFERIFGSKKKDASPETEGGFQTDKNEGKAFPGNKKKKAKRKQTLLERIFGNRN